MKEIKIVFLNGVFDAVRSETGMLPFGVVLEAHGGFHLRIADKVILEDMIHLVFMADKTTVPGTDEREFNVKISAGASTRLNLVLHKGAAANFCPQRIKTEIFLSENACVDYYQIEEASAQGHFFTENFFHLKKHASLDYLVFSAASGISENKTTVEFEEEHGFFSAKGLSMLTGQSRADHLLLVNHRAGHCISRQYFKSVLADDARAGFDSLVHVFADASKSDSQQLNRNLLLSDRAQARSKPELRIDNDDVAASHGSASGQLDDNEIFYLQSRGFTPEMARLVLVDGFAGEIVGEIHEKILKTRLENMIHQGIRSMVGAAL